MSVDNLPIANATTASIRSLHDFQFKPTIMDRLYRIYGNGFNGLDFLRMLDRYEQVSNETLTHEEIGYDMRTITIGSANVTPAGGAGLTASFELDDDDLDSDGNYYPREEFTVQFGDVINGFIQAKITDITVTAGPTVTVTVEPFDSTATLSATYVYAGAEVGIFDSSYAVETGQPEATSMGTFEREHYLQIMKETIKFGGMELAKQKWVYFDGIGLFNEELARAEFALDRQHEAAFLMGQPNTNSITQNSLIDSQANTVYKTKGLWTWTDELGGEITYADATGIGYAEFDEANEYLESQGITNDTVIHWCGGGYMRRVENGLVDYFANPTGVSGAGGGLTGDFLKKQLGMEGKGMEMNVTFKSFTKSGITHVFMKLPAFVNPYQFGISGYMLNDAAIVWPVTTVMDQKTGQRKPNVRALYAGIKGYSRKRIVGTIGGMDGFALQNLGLPIINEVDGNSTYWLAHVGLATMEANKNLLFKRSS